MLFDPRRPFLIPLVLLVISRVLMLLATPASAEDAFITFRYAQNFAAGHGLVYNPGENVMGFTSPIWTVWSALGILVVKDPIPWALGWSMIADVVTLLAGGVLVASVAGAASAWAFTIFFAAWPYFAALAVSGMEMSFGAALLVLSAALVHRRSRLAGVALGALALTRPEGFAAAAVLSLAAGWRERVTALALTAAGLGALTLQFGNPVPNSLLVKAAVYGTTGPWAGRQWWEWISPLIMYRWASNGDGMMMMFLAVVTAPASFAGALELWRRRETPLARLAAALGVVWLAYAAIGAPYFWWYFVYPLLAVAFLGSVGLPHVVRGRAVPIALVLFVLSVWSVALSLHRGRSYAEVSSFGAMADALRQRFRPGDSVMLEPIGMIGYRCPAVVIDETGLVSPYVARRRKEGPGWYTDIIAARLPHWLVVRRGMLENQRGFAGTGDPFRSAAERDSLLSHYFLIQETGVANSQSSLLLLERQR